VWKSRDTDMPVVLDQALTGCMVIFSCLEKEIQRITTGAPEPSRIRWRPRARMVWNESHLNDLLSSLRGQQTAITLLIQLLQMNTLTEMKDMLQRKSEAVRSLAHQTLSLPSKNPSVAVPNSIFGDRNQNPVSQGHDVASVVAPSELEFEFDDIVVNSQAYRRVLARAHQATTPTMERVKPAAKLSRSILLLSRASGCTPTSQASSSKAQRTWVTIATSPSRVSSTRVVSAISCP